ncbi:MAG: DUF4040 domain-containing protein [Lachnospiraceae bacterium]|jgi:uncharacterized MnhB-related membrane protein|nr:DUF4040 domain-containing protein [Lachnospiraceae bacterium]MBR4209084.1 DUF4040 domain-containing protein [Lachnospiraceae bacterium]
MNGVVAVLNTLVILGIIASAILTVRAKGVFSSVICLAAVGSFVTVEFVLLQAPDVAIAEAAVGAVLSTVLYVIALRRTKEEGDYEDEDTEE